MNFKEKYGPWAIVAGASEGLGAAWAKGLASRGINLILLARRQDLLEKFAIELRQQYQVEVKPLAVDLSDANAASKIIIESENLEINFLVYNAALSFIGPFLEKPITEHIRLAQTNMLTPMQLVHHYAQPMLQRRRGGMVLMSSLAGFQGSGYLSAYASSKAYTLVLAESLWYEWKNKGVDVIACCAGATATSNYIATQPGDMGFLAPKAQTPEEVVEECLKKIGSRPSLITGTGNKLASFFMQKILPRKTAIKIMGDTTVKMYRIDENK